MSCAAEGDGLVDQHHRDQVLQANIRDLAIVDDRRLLSPPARLTSLTWSASKWCRLKQFLQRVERRLDRRADGPFLDVGPGDLVALAELVDQRCGIRLRAEGLEEIVRAREDVVDAGPARLHQQSGGDPVARRHATENERLLDMIGIALPGGDAGGCCAV